jgi:hypothetical protein
LFFNCFYGIFYVVIFAYKIEAQEINNLMGCDDGLFSKNSKN